MNTFYIQSPNLQHHGILGMHWGIRRYQPYPKGYKGDGKYVGEAYSYESTKKWEKQVLKDHIIPKGTSVYRVSDNPKDADSGSSYVSYHPVDRDSYRSFFTGEILENRNLDNTFDNLYNNLHETTFTLKEDLKVPSRKTTKKVVTELVSENRDSVKKLVDEHIDELLENMGAGRGYMDDYESDVKRMKDLISDVMINPNIDKNLNLELGFWSIKTDQNMKNKVGDRLQEMGYNAMRDETVLGIDPLLVFDSASSMKRESSTKMTKEMFGESNQRFRKWLGY